jgi:hypothetical protein
MGLADLAGRSGESISGRGHRGLRFSEVRGSGTDSMSPPVASHTVISIELPAVVGLFM